MFSTRFGTALTTVSVAALLVLPGSALAGNPADSVSGSGSGSDDSSMSSVDVVAADVAVDGKGGGASDSSVADASDSPTVDTYTGGGDTGTELPPPVDCDTSGGGASSSSSVTVGTGGGGSSDDVSGSGDSSDASSSDTSGGGPCEPPIVECGDGDTNDRDADGKPCDPVVIECGLGDTDGNRANGSPCIVDGGGCIEDDAGVPPVPGAVPGDVAGDVAGGGDDDAEDCPDDTPPVLGGGAAPLNAMPVAAGGGAELPFTGLPLFWSVGAGLMLIAGGIVLWVRGRRGGSQA